MDLQKKKPFGYFLSQPSNNNAYDSSAEKFLEHDIPCAKNVWILSSILQSSMHPGKFVLA